MRRALAAAACALVLVPAAGAATPTGPVFDEDGNLVQTPFVPPLDQPRLTEARATQIFVAYPKVRDWLERYPTKGRVTDADFDEDVGSWRVKVWWGDAGQIADGRVDDSERRVTEAWTGPQVAWKMARGYEGAFGGKEINRPAVWLAFCVVFLLGLADLRRPLSLRNLDLLALLAFTPSLYFFNRGEVFWSAPLAIPPLLYVIGRLAWIGARGRPTRTPPTWPAWVLLAATVFLLGFRIGLNVQAPYSVIDVGYAGVIGAHRIVNGEMPYGNFPVQGTRPACGPADAEGEIRNRVQTNGRCESSNERGDTYGPVSYLAYVPGFALFGWSGKWGGDTLPAAHFTALAWDFVVVAGLVLVGRRYGGNWLAAALAFAWAAYPFTQYTSNSNTNDALPAAFLVWGFWLATSPWARGVAVALSGWTKFSTLIVAPLWLTYPTAPRARPLAFVAAFLAATAAAFSILLLEPDLVEAVRTFADRTFLWQLDRESPFSPWGWGQYHAAGIPDLKLLQRVLQALLVAAAIAVAFVPRRKSPLQLAALTGALVAGFELVLEHWSYLYIPWFYAFAAFAFVAGPPRREPAPAPPEEREEPRALVAA
ncbi:MAG TPA: hypothetical protein VE444_01015 [Gaiellaceae bacterium]|nr:hypothetical protein [Gaiellaceae bacterium]